MMHWILFALLIALTGCGAAPTRFVESPKVAMPANVRADCEPLPPAPARGATMGKLYEFTGAVVGQYGECAALNRAKADWAASQGQ